MEEAARARFWNAVTMADELFRIQQHRLQKLLLDVDTWNALPAPALAGGQGDAPLVADLIAALLDVSVNLGRARTAAAAALQLALSGGDRPAPLATLAHHEEGDISMSNACEYLEIAAGVEWAQDCIDRCLSALRVLRRLLAPAPGLAIAKKHEARAQLDEAVRATAEIARSAAAALEN